MAFKRAFSAGMFVAACVTICGCQNSPPRTSSSPAFTQRPGSANPPVLSGNPQLAQPSGVVNPTFTSAPGGPGGVPTATPTNAGSQIRSTQQPFIPNSGPETRAGVITTGANPPPPPPAPLGPNFGSPAFDPAIQPPANPAFGGPGLRN